MSFIDDIIRRAQADPKTIVLPEAEDPRVLAAALEAHQKKIANIVLIGNREDAMARVPELDLSELSFVEPCKSPYFDDYVQQYYELRKRKGVNLIKARETLEDKTSFGMMMVKNGLTDGLVSGASHTTADTLRPALQILKTKPGCNLVSAFFIMVTKAEDLGVNGAFIFADCGLNEDPSAEQLSEIAIDSANTFRFFFDEEPRVALLSYSSFGSAHSPLTEKVIEATRIAQQKMPELLLDGELQTDAALSTVISDRKAHGNRIGGKANVLIFPNLDAGNIGYKLVQYLGGAEAYGPLLQGIARPVNDLSRGCSVKDIVGVIAITVVQAQH